jgi:hypothetical protein
MCRGHSCPMPHNFARTGNAAKAGAHGRVKRAFRSVNAEAFVNEESRRGRPRALYQGTASAVPKVVANHGALAPVQAGSPSHFQGLKPFPFHRVAARLKPCPDTRHGCWVVKAERAGFRYPAFAGVRLWEDHVALGMSARATSSHPNICEKSGLAPAQQPVIKAAIVPA